ncbi:MAG: bifunctional phosphoribosylaminoimidazolecarboxamide formyltransferase/IMP cyclohydrolase [Candidatus Levybacteria bacterium]|nr:bifunctional phosphoribosylaminoimidazolecarboxamide formyltransferase/IMP cyclohydrolase [Candidatus Levybacteria bacterium]
MAGKKKAITATKKYALLSVFNKDGIVDFARTLSDLGYVLISTGGTAKTLEQHKIPVIPIQDITGNPESFDGRMKTISFQIESGIIYDRSNPKHVREAKTLKIKPIDIVVCNLYPFEETIQKPKTTLNEAIEHIDVGGPTMVRAAAKNFKNVLVVTDPTDYERVEEALETNQATEKLRKELAAKAFSHLSYYDAQIASYLRENSFPEEITLPGKKVIDLRYGENPHQQGALYVSPQQQSPFSSLQKLWGRDLSLTNVTDINAGLESVRVFLQPAAVVIKHNSPCGIALGKTGAEALLRAIDADPESAFGGVIVINQPIDMHTAKIIANFKDKKRGNIDIIASPRVDLEALGFLQQIRKSMGIYVLGDIPDITKIRTDIKWVDGGFILQTRDDFIEKGFLDWKVVTKKKPTRKQFEQMQIGWKFVTRIRSNSVIVIDKKLPMTRGIGSGQTSRLRSTKIALSQAGKFAKNALLVSDSFFPFDDSVKLASQHGIDAIVQQGGSINDKASIDAADKAGIAMVFTNRRAFWH